MTLAAAVLLGATALTVPFFTAENSTAATQTDAVSKSLVPATGFADLVEAVKPAVVSVTVKNKRYNTSSHRSRKHHGYPDGERYRQYFEQFGHQFKRQSYQGENTDNQSPGQHETEHNCDYRNKHQSWNGQDRDNQRYDHNSHSQMNQHARPRQQRHSRQQMPHMQGYDTQPNMSANMFPFPGNLQGQQPYMDHENEFPQGPIQRGQFMQNPHDPLFNGIGRRKHKGQRRHHRSTNQGSGFIVSADGYVVTNNHVVEHGEDIEVKLSDGKTYAAKLIGTDDKTDLALLKIEADREFEFVEFADDSARVGDWVLAIGNPFGLSNSVTTGIISAKGRDLRSGPYDNYLQIDAPINHGNSGGPAFNLKGQVIGVNTAIYSPTGGNVGIGFAIPASVAKEVIEDLKDDGKVSRGWLGVQIQTITEDIAESLGTDNTKGALVAQVQDGSPAEKAGLKRGDLVLQVGDERVSDPKDLARKVAALDPGSETEFTIFRDGETMTVTVKLGELEGRKKRASKRADKLEETASLDALGLTLSSERDGVVISSVSPDGPAARKGLKAGDEILEVAGKQVSSAEEAESLISAAGEKGRKTVLILVRSGDGGQRFVAVELNRG